MRFLRSFLCATGILCLTVLFSEEFYLLESPYQQLVFSTKGGALVEINLPFRSDKNSESVVAPIEFDKEMVEQAPFNAHFPETSYFTPGKKAPVEHKEGTLGGYYPLLRRDLILNTANKRQAIPARYRSCALISDFPEFAELEYTVSQFDATSITFEATQEQRKITKRFSFATKKEGAGFVPYLFFVDVTITGESKGLWLTSGVPDVELISNSFTPSLKYRISKGVKSEVDSIDLPKQKAAINMSSVYPTWAANSNGYFTIILAPLSETAPGLKATYVSGLTVPTRLADIDRGHQRFKLNDYPGYQLLLPLPSVATASRFAAYAGPLEEAILSQVDQALIDPETEQSLDFSGAQSFQGWFSFISEPFARFLYLLMSYFYKLTHSWAAAIILLTIALRLMLYPLNSWSFKSMRRMQQLAPEVTRIQERYKKEPKKAQIEVMTLYREKKVNPLTGCFPILIQIPFLIGMFDLLKSTFALRGAVFIPGWIDNLTSPDVVFQWSYPIPFIGTSFHLLPLLLGGVMFLQQRLSAAGSKNANTMTDQQRQQRVMGNVMVVVFAVMFYHFPSGLNLYWLCSMLLGVAQQWWTNKQLDTKHKLG